MSTTYLNFKGSIRQAGIRHQDSITAEQLAALGIAARALHCDAHVDAIRAEMNDRLRRACGVIDDAEQDQEQCTDVEFGGCVCFGCNPPVPNVDDLPIPY